MKFILLICGLLLVNNTVSAQFNQLILRKNGVPVKRYTEGSVITLKTKTGMYYSGLIYLLQNDSIYFSGSAIHINEIAKLYKKPKGKTRVIPMPKDVFLYSNLGIPLFTAGLVLSGEPLLGAALAGVGLVYIPIALYNVKRLLFNSNKDYQLGNTYELRLLNLYPSEKLPQQNQ